MKVQGSEACPCGSQKKYESCCQPFHEGKAKPATAALLMASRYSAYVAGKIDYVEATNDPASRHSFDREAAEEWANSSEWLGLEIVATKEGSEAEESGEVEFKANYKRDGQEVTHHEVSLFKRIGSQWYYVDGKELRAPERRAAPKVGRNDPCHCGSGKKYKKCCG